MIEIIRENEVIFAIIISKDHEAEGIDFVSPKDFTLQLGHMKRPVGYEVVPHIHQPIQRKTVGTQEVLFIKRGLVEVDFYNFEHEFVDSRRLSAGDIILLVGAGHGIRVIEEAVIVEVKNGPYSPEIDKGRFEGRKGKGAAGEKGRDS